MIDELQEICLDIAKHKRPLGSFGASYVKSYIRAFTKKHNIPINTETFNTKKINTKIDFNINRKNIDLNILSYPDKSIEGKIIIIDSYKLKSIKTLKDYICVLKIKNLPELELYKDTLNQLNPEGIIFCLEDFDINISTNITGYKMPIYSISSKYLPDIANLESRPINIPTQHTNTIQGENLYFDIGRGPIVYILSSMSSKEDSFGAIYSACSVAFSIYFAQSLLKNYNSDFKFRFFFTEENTFFWDGVNHHITSNPKHVYYAISLINMGWSNPCCFYEDADGENSLYLSDKFFSYIKSLNTNISFYKTNTLSYIHSPFKKINTKTMMFGSYPCIISNTLYDNIESVRFDYLELWYQTLSGFLRRLHAI